MTTINETARNQAHTGIWHRTTHALGKLWAKMIALPDASSVADRRRARSSDYYIFPPF